MSDQTVFARADDDASYIANAFAARKVDAWLVARFLLPFPDPSDAQREAIGAAAAELDRLRSGWLNPPEWTRTEVLEFPGSADGPWRRYVHEPDGRGIGSVRYPRRVPRDEAAAAKLKKRTLTNLYNERPTWLDLAHRRLDEAVCAAYGWPADLADEQILERLLERNLSRAAAE